MAPHQNQVKSACSKPSQKVPLFRPQDMLLPYIAAEHPPLGRWLHPHPPCPRTCTSLFSLRAPMRNLSATSTGNTKQSNFSLLTPQCKASVNSCKQQTELRPFFYGTLDYTGRARDVFRKQRKVRGLLKKRSGMAIAGMVGEAVKGAALEVWFARGLSQKLLIAVSLLMIIVKEIVGLVKLVPYGLYAQYLSSSLETPRLHIGGENGCERRKTESRGRRRWIRSLNERVVLAKNLRYGDAERNLLDVYVPKIEEGAGAAPRPVVMFVHGGVWASGDKWQFSPLGSFLAEQGIISVLVQYTLYPKVLAIDQVSEVSQALSWTMDNIGDYSGDPNRVFLMGHSSGGHLCAMLLWERARLRVEKALRPISEELDSRIPAGFVGSAGVYNIDEHYKYEVGRGVGAISCMRPAMNGENGFDSMSPSLLFESLLVQGGVTFVKDGIIGSAAGVIIKGVDLVPTCLLLASHSDIVVPPNSSFAFDKMLRVLGCDSRVILHEALQHEDFVLWCEGWGKFKSRIGPYLEDILNFVTAETSESLSSSKDLIVPQESSY